MTTMHKKKLIEVALPLEAINKASAREKSIRHGHPSTLHLWWARRPLAAARAVIFAQMVDDPSSCPDLFPTEKAQEKERQRLFRIIENLVLWENTTNEKVLQQARDEIWQSWRRACAENVDHPRAKELFDRYKLPAFHDPFAGGGALPLEAQRLGLEAYASDLNPVAVLINKAMIEIPPKFAGRKPVHPPSLTPSGGGLGGGLFAREWHGAQGLAEDVRYYGQWMRDEAENRIGHLYPKIKIPPRSPLLQRGDGGDFFAERPDLIPYAGKELTVIAWLWARTVKSPNPAFAHVDVPLASTFMLSTKPGKEAYVEPIINLPLPQGEGRGEGGAVYRFTVKVGKPKDAEAAKNGTRLVRGANFKCLMSGTPIASGYIRSEAQAGRMGARLMAIVAEGKVGRVYLSPMSEHEAISRQAQPVWKPELKVPTPCHDVDRLPMYGMPTWGDAFTPRQLVALTTFSDLVQEARERVRCDAIEAWNYSPQRGEFGRGEQWQPTPVPAALLQAARDLRKNMTDAEQLLWQCLRGKQLDNFKFRKQHPIEHFVLDFYCPSAKLAIELDGVQHSTDESGHKDAKRTGYLAKCGIRVLRFWNHDVFNNLDGVLTRIWDVLHEDPHPGPPPLGEGERHLISEGGKPLADGGTGATAYADAVAVYLAFAVSKITNIGSSIASWMSDRGAFRETFARQAIPMVWDFAEANTFADTGGSFAIAIEKGAMAIAAFPANAPAKTVQVDATSQTLSNGKVVSTDPPYYDNIGYADLSDFFYVWLRRSLRMVFPELFATLAVPKAEELVATPYRHGSKEKAEIFFLNGMTQAMHRLAEQAHPHFPVTIYYAFKQSETESDGESGTASTGWDTFLDAVIRAGFAISGTWPMRTEGSGRMIAMGTNALASSIVLVCRPRTSLSPLRGEEHIPSPSGGGLGWGQTATRREFLTALKAELPSALLHLQHGNIAPVDLAQAAIGPGMAIYTRYEKVLDAEGKPHSVREALTLINQILDEALAEQEGDFDSDSRWALAWFEQSGFAEGEYGVAETLSKAKNTSVGGMVEAGIVTSSRGKVRLLKPNELPADWDPVTDHRLTAWEVVHHLIRVLEAGGEGTAAELVRKLGSKAEVARELAYRLYTICERKKRAQEALSYNGLVQSWPEITRLSAQKDNQKFTQDELL